MSIKFKKVSYTYAANSPTAKKALDQVSFTIDDQQFVAVIGQTGSGKSTLMQHFNALLKPTAGEIEIAGMTINSETTNKNLRELRRKVSLVFQFPETQLFESTVLADIAFGLKNFGYSNKKAEQISYEWLAKVGLPEEIAQRSPFELSGGQMRRVAIAGVMAYEPEILCLDEPAAGLDPLARKKMMDLFSTYQKQGHTVILVTHNMDDVANYADKVLVMGQGKLLRDATAQEVFSNPVWLKKHELDQPQAALFAQELENFVFPKLPLTRKDLVKGIEDNLKG